MQLHTVTAGTAHDLRDKIRAGGAASFVTMHFNADFDAEALHPSTDLADAVMGATSCGGAMTEQGPAPSFAALVVRDPKGNYGCGLRPFGDDPEQAAAEATQAALRASGRLGEIPELVWIAATPGVEECVLRGIESVVGPDVPIIGGSAADNSVGGNWFILDGQARTDAGVVVTVMFPSAPISFAYQNGYAPTANRGVVTAAKGRQLIEIDGRPAGEVYAEWTDTAVSKSPAPGTVTTILSESALWPLGREIGDMGGVPSYLLAHPAAIDATQAVDLFARVEEGEVLTQMTGSIDGLVTRAGRVAALTARVGGASLGRPAGALMVYCGGCRMTVEDRLSEVVDGMNLALGTIPFLGVFTFGEQGPVLGQGNRHGNLMISCIIFGSS